MTNLKWGARAVAGVVAVLVCQPVLVWNNPNLYFFVGASILLLYLLKALQNPDSEVQVTPTIGLGILLIAVGLLAPVLSGFSTRARVDLAGLPKVATETGLPALDVTEASLVSRTVAIQVLAKLVTENADLRDKFRLGSPVKQAYAGKLVWVAPLEPRNFMDALVGAPAPGYAIVDASDEKTARLVRAEVSVNNGNLLSLDTRVWLRNPTLDVYGWYFELDDEGRPHWIGVLTERKIGFRGYDVVGAVAIDVSTARQTRYTRDEIPLWVNNKFPMELVAAQINAAGDLENGLFDLHYDGKFELASGLTMVFFDSKSWYLGLLSAVGHEDFIDDVVLVDTQTKEVRRVRFQGISAQAAARVLASKAPISLSVSRPIPYLVAGVPAYVSSFADDHGALKAVGLVSARNPRIVSVAPNLSAAVTAFTNQRAEANEPQGTVPEVPAM